jgi:acyl carrier protein
MAARCGAEHDVTPEAVLERIRAIAATRLRITAPVDLDSDLARDLRLDSIAMLSLVVEIENEFEICLEPDDEHGIATVGDVVTLLLQRLSAEHEERIDG